MRGSGDPLYSRLGSRRYSFIRWARIQCGARETGLLRRCGGRRLGLRSQRHEFEVLPGGWNLIQAQVGPGSGNEIYLCLRKWT